MWLISIVWFLQRQQNRKNSARNKSPIVISYRRNITLIAVVLYWCLHKHKFMQILCWSSYRNCNVWEHWGFISMLSRSITFRLRERAQAEQFILTQASGRSGLFVGMFVECWGGGDSTCVVFGVKIHNKNEISDAEGKHAILTHKYCMHWNILQRCIRYAAWPNKVPTWI